MAKKKGKGKYQNLNLENDKTAISNKVLQTNVKKERNPGIDFGRIVCMYAIVLHHILFFGGIDKYSQYKELRILNLATFWHVDGFIFISGYIGHKTTKYSNLFYLWCCTLFYSIGITLYFSKFKPHIYKRQIEFNDFFPVINEKDCIYWYFTAYFGMYLFLPVVNKGIENISKSQLKITVLSFILVFSVLPDYINPKSDIFHMNIGMSVIWHLIFFIVGSYFGKFKKDGNCFKKVIKIIIYALIFYFSTYLCIKLPEYPNYTYDNKQSLKSLKYKVVIFLKSVFIQKRNSLSMILESISVILILINIHYNKYIAKVITFIGPLTFGVYLIHEHSIVREKIIRNILKDYPRQLPLNTVYKIITYKALKVFVICIIIDYFRDILFRILQIRKICILIEKLIFKLFG